MSEKIVLELKGVCHSYRGGNREVPVLRGVDFQLERGKWCCIFGASGSGKTTLMNLIGALETPTAGTIRVDGKDISKFSRGEAAEFRRNKIGFVFQVYHLMPELNALDNVALAGRLAGMSAKNAADRAKKLLAKVGLAGRMTHLPSELSGGEQQRCSIARSLMNSPKLLLADEPTGNLDAETGKEILDLLNELRKLDPDLTIMMITHNPELVEYADKVATLSGGVLV